MYSYFSVILLWFSGVYCISPEIENLNLSKLKQILSSETTIEEWETAMNQDIIYNENGTETTVNVENAVYEFVQKTDNGDVMEFETIHNKIKTAYRCTLAKYASLTAYLIIQDMRTMKANITHAVILMKRRNIFEGGQSIFTNSKFMEYFEGLSKKQQFHLDFDFKFRGRNIQYEGKHDFDSTPSKEWHEVWAAMLEKRHVNFKIKYKIYPDVIGTKFTNEFDLPDVHILNEIVCVLNEAIQLFDNFVAKNCVQHGGSFLKNFRSLEKGVNSDLIGLANIIDEKIANESSRWALYRDYSIPGPGTSQADNVIGASGGFVENALFVIGDSSLNMDFPNSMNPTEMYGHPENERTSEFILGFYSVRNLRGIKVCTLMVRDIQSWCKEQGTERVPSSLPSWHFFL